MLIARIRLLRLMGAMLSTPGSDYLQATWELAVCPVLAGALRPGAHREHQLAHRIDHQNGADRAEHDGHRYPAAVVLGGHHPAAVRGGLDHVGDPARPAP